MRTADFHGYTIYEDGTIIGLYGKEVKKRINNGRYEVRLNIEGKRKNYIVSRLVYYVFNEFDINDQNLCVSYKDNDKLNIDLSNLYLTHRKDLIQGDKHRSIARVTDEQAEEIRQLWKGKTGNNQYDKEGYSLQDIANMYGITKANVNWIIKGWSRNEEDYKLK